MTLEETYRKIAGSDELRKRYIEITTTETLENLLKELGCRETPEEFMKYVKEQNEGEIPDTEIEDVAGGFIPPIPHTKMKRK